MSPSVQAKDGDNEGGAPIGIVEILATGTFVISSKHCDIPNVIEDNVSGLLADEMDINAIADKIVLLYQDPILCEQIRINGRKRIESKFNVNEQAKMQAQIYKNILD